MPCEIKSKMPGCAGSTRLNRPFFAALEAFCRAYCTLVESHRSVRSVGPDPLSTVSRPRRARWPGLSECAADPPHAGATHGRSGGPPQQHWPYFYARSLGCVGVLKEWLVRATALALRDGSDTLTLAHLERRALSEAKCARIAADIQDGEQTLRTPEASHHRLLALLGMSEMPSLASDAATPMPPAELAHTESRAAPPHHPTRPRVGQRRPQRDPVGAMAQPATPTKCLGSGALDVDAHCLTQSTIGQVECPVCGAVRPAKLTAQRVVLPVHAPLKTHTTRKGARWIKGETGWALSQP
jgi:hypothetical protein